MGRETSGVRRERGGGDGAKREGKGVKGEEQTAEGEEPQVLVFSRLAPNPTPLASYEVILVDDCSTDNTVEVLEN